MQTFHQLWLPGKILYGYGSFKEAGRQAAALGRKALIVSDSVMDRMGQVAELERMLAEASVASAKYAEVNSEPTDRHVREALDICRNEKCDVIVALGGGSPIDTAKAVAVMMTNDGFIGDYIKRPIANAPLPLVAIPTTAGTGSEVTRVTVITDTATEVKMMIAKPELVPAVAIVDPELTLSCPPHVTAATGIDALCHAMEAYISRRAHPVTDMYALKAVELLAGYLRRVYKDGSDREARGKVSLGAMLAGAAFSNASVTLIHGMSRPIGALFHVPHGVSNAMLLPAVFEFTKEAALPRFADLAVIFRPDLKDASDAEKADALIRELKSLCHELNIPNLAGWGIDRSEFYERIPKMCSDALASGSPDNNPRVPTAEEIGELYKICYDYNYQA